MKLIAGLGNPGLKYQKTRHNLGFRTANQLAQKYQLGIFKEEKKFKSQITMGFLNNEKVILAKPQTFMNNSGPSIKAIADYYKIMPQDILIIHDDIDLPLGQIRLHKNRGAAGHKGVQSIIDALKTKDFIRIRMGLALTNQAEINTEEFVLQDFSDEELAAVEQSIKKAIKLITEAFELA